MTVITRRETQAIVIGSDLCVTVLEVQADHVRLAFESSDRVPAYWEETIYLDATDDESEFEDAGELEVLEPMGVFLEA
jgi:carbon storage regulator CsrA